MEVFEVGLLESLDQRKVVVGGVGTCAQDEGRFVRVEAVGLEVLFPFISHQGFLEEVGAEEEAYAVVACRGHPQVVGGSTGFGNGTEKVVGLGVDPAPGEAVVAVEFPTIGDCDGRLPGEGILGDLEKAVVEMGVGAEDDVRAVLEEDFLELSAAMDLAGVLEVGDEFEVVEVEVVGERELFLDEIVELDAKIVEGVCALQGLVDGAMDAGCPFCPCFEGTGTHVVAAAGARGEDEEVQNDE